MSRHTVASLEVRIVSLEALVTELKAQLATAAKPVRHVASTTTNTDWDARKAAAIAEAKRTGKAVLMPH